MSEIAESRPQSIGGPKKKASKSRNGCLTCKKKRLKCDETKPSCLKCLKKNLVCGGYAVKFKWRAFNDSNDSAFPSLQETPNSSTTLTSAGSIDATNTSMSAKSPDSFRKHLELASLSVTGKSIKEIKRENDLIQEGINPSTYLKNRHPDTSKNNTRLLANLGDSSLRIDDGSLGYKRMKRSYSQPETAMDPRAIAMARSFSYSTEKHPYRQGSNSRNGALNSLADVAIDEINKSPAPQPQPSQLAKNRRNSISHHSPKPVSSFSPSLSDFLSPSIPIKSPVTNMTTKAHSKALQKNVAISPAAHSNFDLNIKLSPSLSALINSAFGNENEFHTSSIYDENLKLNIPLSPLTLQTGHPHELEDDHSIASATPVSHKWHEDNIEAHALHSVTESFSAPNDKRNSHDSALSPGVSAAASVYSGSSSNSSLLHSGEQQQILGLYAEYTSEILSIKNGPLENPWRRLILPLAFDYSCLYNSIASLTLFHLVGNERVASTRDTLRARGYIHMKKCILELASGLSRIDSNDELSTQLPADIAIAICLNLAVSESWDKHISSGIAHLKGAKTMIQKVLSLLRETKKTLATKRRLAIQNPDVAGDEYGALVISKKEQLGKRLVLVEDSEWDNLLTADEESDTGNRLVKFEESEKPLHIPKSTQFLFNIWIYFEVLAQMTTDANNDEKGIDLVASITTLLHEQKNEAAGNKNKANDNADKSPGILSESSESTFASIEGSSANRGFNIFDNIDNLSFDYDQIDPLLGCAQSLFSIMGKVAALVGRIRKSKSKSKSKDIKTKPTNIRNSLATITAATQLRQQLLSWKPTISTSMMQHTNGAAFSETDPDFSSTITTAEAYRYSALLYLHQAVPEIPSPTSHQLAEKIFILLASIPTTSSTYTTHIFPLLVASCEAESAEEREWCVQRWEVLSKKLWIGNVDRAFEVVKEVWKRKDDYVRKRNTNSLGPDDVFITLGNDKEKLRDISNQMSGLMAAINSGDQGSSVDDITGGIFSKLHWSSIMKEWGWEVLLG